MLKREAHISIDGEKVNSIADDPVVIRVLQASDLDDLRDLGEAMMSMYSTTVLSRGLAVIKRMVEGAP